LNLSNTQQKELEKLQFSWSVKRSMRQKPPVGDMAVADAAAATMPTKVARKKKGATASSELNPHLENAASIAAVPTMVTSGSNSTVIDHQNKAEDTDFDGKRATNRGSRSNKDLRSIRADRSSFAENRASSRLLKIDATIAKLQAEIKCLEAKNMLEMTQEAAQMKPLSLAPTKARF
jgi:hypothetical protein